MKKDIADHHWALIESLLHTKPLSILGSPAKILQTRRLPEGARDADRSACHRNFPVIVRTGVEFPQKPASGYEGATVRLDHRGHSSGSRCPHFNVEEPGEPSRGAEARPT